MTILRQKVPWLVFTVLAVSFLTFMLTSLLPGDPARQILGEQATPEAVDAVRDDLGLDDPLPIRYLNWLGAALTGDLGSSYTTGQPVEQAIAERVPVTFQLGLMAVGIALVLAIPLGVISAYRSGGAADRVITGGTFALLSVPNFMMAILLIYGFAVYFPIFPATGWTRFTEDPFGSLRSAFLPALSLAAVNLAVFSRLLRSDMIATLQEDFVTMAEAKGLSTKRILFRHAFRLSSFSLLTVVGIQLGAVIGGSVVVEQIFALPGVGRLLYDSILQRDLLMVQGVVLVISVTYITVNFVVDLLYSYLDPRIRHGNARAAV
ncbi:MAG: ABC transporter permease [Actinomycetota bacterium]|nr:ABC transporter permease [Actinomycetota bacterium]